MTNAADQISHGWWTRYNAIVDSQLSGNQKLAMIVVAAFAGDANECFASMGEIARKLSVKPDAAGKTIASLHQAGFIDRVPRKHEPSILLVRWERFGLNPRSEESTIDDSDDRRLDRSQPEESPIDTSSLNTKKNTHKESEPAKRFVPPTVEEVAAYCVESGNTIDPQAFVDHYVANGWMCGKSKMRDWQATVRNWERNQHKFDQQRSAPRSLFDGIQEFSEGGDDD